MGNSETTRFSFYAPGSNGAKKMCLFNNNTYQLEDKEGFLDFLQKNSSKKIKIFSAIGKAGEGKSTFLNFILKNYSKSSQKNSLEFFKTGDQFSQCTLGIDYYLFDEGDTITVFLDCQGLDGFNSQFELNAQYEDFERSLDQLLSLICKISTSIFVITRGRLPKDVSNLIENATSDCLDSDNTRLKDFIIVKMRTNKLENYQKSPQEQQFGDVVFCNFLSGEQYSENCHSFLYNEKFDEVIRYLVDKHVINKQKSKNSNLIKMFQDNQTCQILYEYLIPAYALLDNQFGKFKSSTKNYFKVIDSLNNAKLLNKKDIQELENKCTNKIIHLKQKLESLIREKKHYSLFTFDMIYQLSFQQMLLESQEQYNRASDQWIKSLDQLISQCFEDQSEEQQQNTKKYFQNINNIVPVQFQQESIQIQDLKFQQQQLIQILQFGGPILTALFSLKSIGMTASARTLFFTASATSFATATLAILSVIQLNNYIKDKSILNKIKDQKIQMRQQITLRIADNKQINFEDLEVILGTQNSSLVEKLPQEVLKSVQWTLKIHHLIALQNIYQHRNKRNVWLDVKSLHLDHSKKSSILNQIFLCFQQKIKIK